jgi:hypothetical protein
MRVLARQIGSYCFAYELKGASTACGKQLTVFSSPSVEVSA